jgi:hypothetical protein
MKKEEIVKEALKIAKLAVVSSILVSVVLILILAA